MLAETALNGGRAAYFAPIYDMCEEVADELEHCLAGRIASQLHGHRYQLDTGGVIDLWSMSNGGDRARGRKYHRVCLDEVAMVLGLLRFWANVVRPTLLDYTGDAWFASTPRRGSDFERLYRTTEDGWKSWTFTTWDNPFIPRAELEHARETMPEETYAQEIMADFEATDSDLVYTLDRAKTVVSPAVAWGDVTWKVAGIDPGGGDPTAIVPLGITRAVPLLAPRVGSLSQAGALHVSMHQYGEFRRAGNVSVDDIAEWLSQRGPWAKVAVGETGGDIITTTLQRYGFPAEKADMSRSNIDSVVRWVLDSGRLTIGPECAASIAEFDAYRWAKKRDQAGETFATSTPDWTHADLMDARRYAVMAVVNGLPIVRQPVRLNFKNASTRSARYG